MANIYLRKIRRAPLPRKRVYRGISPPCVVAHGSSCCGPHPLRL